MAKALLRIHERQRDADRDFALDRDPSELVVSLMRRPMREVELDSVPKPIVAGRRLRSASLPVPARSEIVFRQGTLKFR